MIRYSARMTTTSHQQGGILSARRCTRRASASASMKLPGLSVCHHHSARIEYVLLMINFWSFKDAFIRDELSKGRYDPAITKVGVEMMFELFNRSLKVDVGESDGKKLEVEDVC